jgi:hypothetical protein
MKRVGIGIGIENDHGSRRVGGRLECLEIAQVEPLVAERRAEAQAGKMIRHLVFLFGGDVARQDSNEPEISQSSPDDLKPLRIVTFFGERDEARGSKVCASFARRATMVVDPRTSVRVA